MSMKILVLGGCGIQGKAILYDLSRSRSAGNRLEEPSQSLKGGEVLRGS